MTRGDAIPGRESGDAGQLKPDAHFAADIPPERRFDSPADPDPDAVEEDPRLSAIREFQARDDRRRQRRRRSIGICAVVAGTGLLIAAVTAVARRTELRSSTTSGVPAHVDRGEGREALSPSTEPLRTFEDRTSVAKGSNTVTEEQRTSARTRPARPSSTASAPRADQTSRDSVQQAVPNQNAVYPQSVARLTAVRPGDTKEKVFETFATVVERRNGGLVRIEGLRLRAHGRSPHYQVIEVADVRVADTTTGTLRWFLFGDGRLLAWGRAEQWAAVAERYEVATEYKPGAAASHQRRPGTPITRRRTLSVEAARLSSSDAPDVVKLQRCRNNARVADVASPGPQSCV
jgi:hypothetical protein